MTCRSIRLAPDIQVIFCPRDLEERWFVHLAAEYELEHAQWEIEQDIDHEQSLALQHVYGELDEPWPWYADEPCVVVKPQVFGP